MTNIYMSKIVLFIAPLLFWLSPAFAVTYYIETDCRSYTTESPQSGASATDALVDVLPGDLVIITFKDWVVRSPSGVNSYAYTYDNCGYVRYASSTSTNNHLVLQSWFANADMSDGLTDDDYVRHEMPGNGTDFVLTFEAEASVSSSQFQFAFGSYEGGGPNELGMAKTYGARKAPAPVVTNVSSSSADGYYKVGDVIYIDILFSSAVTVTGTPTLGLETGAIDRVASYISGSGSNTLSFAYTVQEGDTAADLDFLTTAALDVNDGTIIDSSDPNVAAVLTLPAPNAPSSLAGNAELTIDATIPVISDSNVSVSGASGAGGVFLFGDTLTVAWDPIGGDGDTNLSESLGSVTFDFSQFGGGSAVPATLVDGKWVATYVIALGQSNTGTNLNVAVTAVDAAGNITTLQDTANSTVGSPASEFDDSKDDIRKVITDSALRSLTSTMGANQRMVQDARARLQAAQSRNQNCANTTSDAQTSSEGQDCENGGATSPNTPFDVDGGLAAGAARVTAQGSFFGQTNDPQSGISRIVSGDFDIMSDLETGSNTGTMNSRVAWEHLFANNTLLGYFFSGEFAHSEIDGSFGGEQTKTGLNVGVYGVRSLNESIYLDGFISVGAGRNRLTIKNDVLSLNGVYTTLTQAIGASISGVYDYQAFAFHPEMSVSYGRTQIGNVGLIGKAYGLIDDGLSLDASDVSISSLSIRPELVWELNNSAWTTNNSHLNFSPRFFCQNITDAGSSNTCGAGAEFGYTAHSGNGLGSTKVRIISDKIDNTVRTSIAISVEKAF